MTTPKWLDRIWLWAIGVAFVIMVPIWLIEWSQDYGVLNVALFFLVIFLFALARHWPSTG
jgi:uncharacterized membrane protein